MSKFTEKMHSIIRSREVTTIPHITTVWTRTKDTDLITIPEVRAGVMLLDQRKPGWPQQVNAETLNLASAMECVLGQLYGSYADGLSALWPKPTGWDRWRQGDVWDALAEQHGFEAPACGRDDRREVLAQEWKRHVLRQQYARV